MDTPALSRTAHASGLHAVERELANLHAELLRSSGEDARMVRLSVLTLVAVCSGEPEAQRAEEVLARLAREHPARAIIIVSNPDGGGGIDAELSLHCTAAGGGAQVCVEQVRLRVSGAPNEHLASVVTPLLVPDVPVYVWLVGAPPLDGAFGHQAVAVADRLIVDSGAYPGPAATLARLVRETEVTGSRPVVDLAWARTRVWREQLAGCFDGAEMRRFIRAVRSLTVVSNGREASAQAWLLLGWMASRLDWPATGGPQLFAVHRAVEDVPEHDLLSVELSCDTGEHQASVMVQRRAEAITCTITVDGGLSASSGVSFPTGAIVDLVIRLLENSDPDTTYAGSLHRAAAFATAAG